jgi:hypothetical protein
MFKHSNSDRIGVLVIMAVSIIASLMFFSFSLLLWLAFVVLIVFGLGIVYKRIPGKSQLVFDKNKKSVFYNYPSFEKRWIHYSEIVELNIASKFVDEYSSSFKNTSEEYLVKIGMKLKSGKNLPLFKLSNDFLEPSKEIIALHDWLEGLLAAGKENPEETEGQPNFSSIS